ncbi:hypothetical protein GlitD10_2749 [Gloeomargarita lithophora Alchichica-D10]|uniref:Uncharacterized protein n=1 Tax=Gloeomargarita lithophora Alchichica-D10 TaxID=1188229 RepID=A0A1J0AGM2_9CYAN|nr:hypothetical protein [Gloeomargarita lithophora]APB35092.1 hypothetical protein GlitD10_2749 [Gloeomargarita lithophora Alchichica-D10]
MTTPEYEELLAECSQVKGAMALLKCYRSYLELLPSMRRQEESLITVVLPLVRQAGQLTQLPCELAFLPCDPTWQVKTDQEILVFIHRIEEDFSQLMHRWRQAQIVLGQPYEWVMPPRHSQVYNEGAEKIYPLFILWPSSPHRIRQGLQGAGLPVVIHAEPASTTRSDDHPDLVPDSDPV